MIDSTYAVQVLAWSVAWTGAGVFARQWLATKAPRR